MYIHKTLTEDVLIEACERSMFGLDSPGFCIKCGAERDGCEPDAEHYECYDCGAMEVYGAEQLLILVA